MVQWREHSPPTNVARFRFPVSASYVEFVVGSRLFSEGFSSCTPVFLPTFPNFNSTCKQWKEESLRGCH